MPPLDGNFQDYVRLTQDSLYHTGPQLQLGSVTATTVQLVYSNSAGALSLAATATGNASAWIPSAGGTIGMITGLAANGGGPVTGGNVVFSNSNGVSFGLAGSTFTASVNAVTAINVSAGTTSQNLTAFTLSNSNNVSFGLNGSTITASATVASTQASVNLSAGTTSNLASAFTFGNANGVSFGLNASTITASIVSSLSNINVSAGTTSQNLSAITFSNSNGVSFGLNGSTLTASINALTALNLSAGTTSNNLTAFTLSNSNNVSFGLNGSTVTASAQINVSGGTTSNNLSAITFSNSNNVSFGLNGSTMTASVTVASTQASINVSAGTTSNLLSAFTFANGNGVSFGLNASTVTASFGAPVIAFSQDADFVTNFQITQAAVSFQKLSMPMNLSATQLVFLADFEGATNSSGGVCISHAVYTMNASTASLASSGSRYISWTSGSQTTTASVYGGASGTRYRTIPVGYSLSQGDYLFAWWVSTVNNVTCAMFGRPSASIVGGFDGVETSYFMHGTSIRPLPRSPPRSSPRTRTTCERGPRR